MRLFASLWFCCGSDYPRKVGAEAYWSDEFVGASVSFVFGYVALEWRR